MTHPIAPRARGRGRDIRQPANPQQPLTKLTDYDREACQAIAGILANVVEPERAAGWVQPDA